MKKLALALLATACSVSVLSAQQPLPSAPNKVPLELGAAWYPEQWPEARWDADLTLMEQAHIHFVRVGEFAWSTMEPHEGFYQLDWLDLGAEMANVFDASTTIAVSPRFPWLRTTTASNCANCSRKSPFSRTARRLPRTPH